MKTTPDAATQELLGTGTEEAGTLELATMLDSAATRATDWLAKHGQPVSITKIIQRVGLAVYRSVSVSEYVHNSVI